MKNFYIFLFLIPLLNGCELWVIGGEPKQKVIPMNQQSSIGAIFLFKAELDSNNLRGASEVMAQPSGDFFLAIEKYEMFDEIQRLARLICKKEITNFRTDTLAENSHKIIVSFDYVTEVSFLASKISDNWYITHFQEQMHWY